MKISATIVLPKKLRLACVYAALTIATSAAAEPASLLEGKGAADAVAKLTAKMKAPVRVLLIEIEPASLTLQVQDPAAPTHIDEYKYVRRPGVLALLGDAAVSGPDPVQLNLINPRLEENLFNLTDVNFAAVPETISEALMRVKVEGGEVQGATIRRQLLLNQSGPVEWSIYIRGPRESASAYADAQGKIRRLDLTGTTRAKTLDLTQGGEMLADAIAAIREQFGPGPVFTSFSISTTSVGFRLRDPKNPADSVGHYWEINGLHKSTDIMPPEVRRRMGAGARDEQLFGIDDVDWSRLPALRPIALEKAAVPDGRIQGIDVGRPETVGEAKPVRWKFDVRAGVLGENTSVEFDAKSGAFTRLVSPKSREKVVNYADAETARRAIPVIGKELSRATGFVEIMFYREKVSIKAPTTEKPELIRQFLYKENEEVLEFGMSMPGGNPFHRGFTKDWLFALADLEPALPRLEELQRKTLERLRLSEGQVERMTFFRHSEFYPQNRKVLLEIRAANPKGEDGRVVYDLQGRVIDVVGGVSEKADAASEAEAPAKLRPLGITDATPARVKKFDSYFASFLKLNQKFGETPWYKLRESAPDKLFTLPREEFRKFGKLQCDILGAVDGMLKVFAERTPPSEAIASSEAAPHARTREFWETFRKVWDACCQQFKVLDKNWEDWKTIGNPPDTPDKKPWQQEVDRLQTEIQAASKRIEELSPPD